MAGNPASSRRIPRRGAAANGIAFGRHTSPPSKAKHSLVFKPQIDEISCVSEASSRSKIANGSCNETAKKSMLATPRRSVRIPRNGEKSEKTADTSSFDEEAASDVSSICSYNGLSLHQQVPAASGLPIQNLVFEEDTGKGKGIPLELAHDLYEFMKLLASHPADDKADLQKDSVAFKAFQQLSIASSSLAAPVVERESSSIIKQILHALILAGFCVFLALLAAAVAHQPSLHITTPPT
ncbi:hypothetical protein COCOBI_03-5460 [Coccomyxa sp. Obi]|nr:hypothetical protein COCOBI_03-5460 [Coccomyxa sp. Obi]